MEAVSAQRWHLTRSPKRILCRLRGHRVGYLWTPDQWPICSTCGSESRP